ncbi:hypothetical protein PYW07_012792 [Mythimna separata]|uniref:Protein cueball n=1 Tax=Mythimna separata TaxID=271217 RepID=A0AAD8DKV9_MYTSE|nr:hypothetical protein PYW07_012792 [Mythimna separata]
MHSTRVVAVLTLVVGLAHCFQWDIVVGGDKQLHFDYNGTLTHTEEIPSATDITSVTYDPVHYRVLFTYVNYPNMTISSFDLSTRKIQSLLTTKTDSRYVRVVYDPVTQLLFWKAWHNIYTFSLNPASSDKAVDGNLLVTMNNYCQDIAVDSCGGYIYWITDANIERARFDGSDREVVVDKTVYFRPSLAIDQLTKRIYWIDSIYLNGGCQMSIESANFNGKNQTTIYIAKTTSHASSLAVSKDFIYWQIQSEVGTWQLPKNSSEHVARKLYSTPSLSDYDYHRVATNYTIQEQIEEIQCEALQNLIPNNSKPEPTASICQNSYCLEGNCSVNAGGQPTCSCKAGHSGERCQVSVCHQYCLHSGVCSLNEEKEPVCQCTTGYYGQRCETSTCKEYCLQGNCSLSAEGQPKCSCHAGYSGERCEVNACHEHCLNNGTCTLNEEDEPFCECPADYEGQRCDVAITHAGDCADTSTQQVLRDLRSEVRQLQHALQLFSDKIGEYEAKI